MKRKIKVLWLRLLLFREAIAPASARTQRNEVVANPLPAPVQARDMIQAIRVVLSRMRVMPKITASSFLKRLMRSTHVQRGGPARSTDNVFTL
jgi:hypothetical protein